MRPGFSARRRAERFHEALDRASSAAADSRGGSTPEDAWVALVEQLRSAPQVQPRPGFVSELREQLMTVAETELAPSPASVARSATTDPSEAAGVERLRLSPGRSRRERRFAAAIGGIALVGAGTSMAVASQGALPGDALYPLKRAIENVRTSLPMEDDARGSALLDNASDRLAEAETLSRRGEDDGPEVTQALEDFTEQASEASDLLMTSYETSGQEDDIREVRSFTAQSMDTLTALADVVPPQARPALAEAAQVVWAIDSAARRLCSGCGGPRLELVPELALDPASVDLGQQLDALTGATAGSAGRDRSRGDGSGKAPDGTKNGGSGGSTAGGGSGSGGAGGQDGGTETQVPSVTTSGTDLPAAGSSGADALGDLVEGVGEALGGVLGTDPAPGSDAGSTGTKDDGTSGGKKKGGGKKSGSKKKGGNKTGDSVEGTLDSVTESLDNLTGGLLP